ncbi:[3-methyl-2-oxobutanoate dehydrogenase [lipoamide]] kinase, mitochondrial [Smittium mucronatum]|uniref:Protein-serine/threonine kinase n=1 Tax=Smittium mucronatum TaxID=133383 RepID=A0A1R0GRL5_9FUNG|nr:[3-methyl-2-oxobutanoate dehydrogenase [lipoamide]] kinase, mitochondrial [Smittium mucronatum]
MMSRSFITRIGVNFQASRLYSRSKKISFYDTAIISNYAHQDKKPVKLKDLLSFGSRPITEHSLLEFTRYSQTELPVRLAKRVLSFHNLPFIVGTNPHVNENYRLYFSAFDRIRSFKPVQDLNEERSYSKELLQTITSLSNVIPTIAQGFLESRKYLTDSQRNIFLDDLIMSRIGLRVIGEHQVALSEQFYEQEAASTPDSIDMNWIGNIHTKLDVSKIIQQVCLHVQNLCELHYGQTCDFIIENELETHFCYIPSHLEYMFQEILKNSFRATVEHEIKNGPIILNGESIAPIHISITSNEDSICIRFRDRGGGIPSKSLSKIFNYSYSTYYSPESDDGLNSNIIMQTSTGGPIAGLGFGIPMTKVYAQYFGGSLDLVSIDDYGCDVFLKLPNISHNLGNISI